MWFYNRYVQLIWPMSPLQMSPDEDGLETSVVGLRFKVREKHFKTSGDLKAWHTMFFVVQKNQIDYRVVHEVAHYPLLTSK